MDEKIHKQFFPMKLPSDVVAQSMDQDATQESTKAINHLIFLPDHKQSVGLFETQESGHDRLERLRRIPTRSFPHWLVFYSDSDEPIGWFLGFKEAEEPFFIDTICLIPAFRGQGIFSAFLRQFVAYLRAMGDEGLTTSQGLTIQTNLFADFKVGFDIVVIELHKGCMW